MKVYDNSYPNKVYNGVYVVIRDTWQDIFAMETTLPMSANKRGAERDVIHFNRKNQNQCKGESGSLSEYIMM